VKKYNKAIRYLNDQTPSEEDEEERKKLPAFYALKATCYLNRAACRLKQEQGHQVVQDCSFVLDMSVLSEKDRVKALYRRGCALHLLKEDDDALRDLEAAAKSELGANDAGIKKELTSVRKSLAIKKEKEKRMYSKMFA
jgi:peptidyl-prolyl isomerase D